MMKKWLLAVIVCTLVAAGCSKYQRVEKPLETDETAGKTEEEKKTGEVSSDLSHTLVSGGEKPVKVKGIYISGSMAGSEGLKEILDSIEGTEINAVVIDVKNDDGRITFAMDDAPTVNEINATVRYIRDINGLMADLKARGLYTIARVVAFRDPYLAEKKPEWALKRGDGSLHRDNKGLAWVNPYRTEVWDYLVEVGSQAAEVGFDEVQFDYIRFATDNTMELVVFDEEDTRGRARSEIITEFMEYTYNKLTARNVFVSADVFGTIIGSSVDAQIVGQVYNEMAGHLDYICPMIYPSHYGDWNFGIEHPDAEPYKTVYAALKMSKKDLEQAQDNGRQAVVRPWLQDFTATYLDHYIPYGPKEVREQIQAVYDAGYDQWILWSATNRYTWEALLTEEEAEEEARQIGESRQALEKEEKARTAENSSSEAETLIPTETETALKPETSMEGKVAETEPEKKESKKRVRKKPNVVIVTTGDSGE